MHRPRRRHNRRPQTRYFGDDVGLLEIVANAADYRRSVHDLVTGPDSTAQRVIDTPFDALPFHLTAKCDGCLYNEFCMKRSVERDDLSLLPHLMANDKGALLGAGIATIRDLADRQGTGERRYTGTSERTRRRAGQGGACYPIGRHLAHRPTRR